MDQQPRKQRALTLKQELFIRHYLGQARGNATEACRLAGYAGDAHQLQTQGTDNLQHPIISMRIKEHVTEVAASADDVLTELATVAFADWQTFVVQIRDANGNTVGARMDLKDKVRALELIGKYHRLFTDKVETNGPVVKAVIGVDLDEV